MKQLAVDLVILNERAASYVQDLQIALETQLRVSQSRPQLGADEARGAVFLLRMDLVPEQTRARLAASLAWCWSDSVAAWRTSWSRCTRIPRPAPRPPPSEPQAEAPAVDPVSRELEFFNGLGGFGRGRGANTSFSWGRGSRRPLRGSMSSPMQASGSRSRPTAAVSPGRSTVARIRLTPWSKRSVTDRPGEVLYLRDRGNRRAVGTTAAPIQDPGSSYRARHGLGYSRFEHASRGIALDLLTYVPTGDAVKISRLKIRNTSPRPRRLSGHGVCRMGARVFAAGLRAVHCDRHRSRHRSHVRAQPVERRVRLACGVSRICRTADAVDRRSAGVSRTPWHARQAGRPPRGTALSGRVGAGLDPCCALQHCARTRAG